jgi:hypothetical protein
MKVPQGWYENVEKMYKRRHGPEATSGVVYDPDAHDTAAEARYGAGDPIYLSSSGAGDGSSRATTTAPAAWSRATEDATYSAPWLRAREVDSDRAKRDRRVNSKP